MSMNYKKLYKLIDLFGWMMVIFMFSHQPHSGDVTHHIIEDLFPVLNGSITADILNFIVRKSAHFMEYFILTFLFYSFLSEYFLYKKWQYFFSVLFCFIYALSDELHQAFVPGRTASIRDCFIDLAGGVFFIIICLLFYNFNNKKSYVKGKKIRVKKYVSMNK